MFPRWDVLSIPGLHYYLPLLPSTRCFSAPSARDADLGRWGEERRFCPLYVFHDLYAPHLYNALGACTHL